MQETKNAGRVLGSQIYVYPSFNDIPKTIPLITNDFFVNQTTGMVYSYVIDEDGEGEWVYKFTIPNNDLLISNEQRIAAVEEYFTDGMANRAIADSHGAPINAADYPSLTQDNQFLGENDFNKGASFGRDVKVSKTKIEVFRAKSEFTIVFTKETEGEQPQHVYYRFPYDADEKDGDNFDLSTLSQVAAAAQAALTTAENYSDAKLAAAVAAILGSPNFTGDVSVAGNLVVGGKMIYVESETVSTESRFIQLIKGNSVPVVGYVGIVVPHYNVAGNDFFLGMDGGIIVFGKVQATFGPKGEVLSVTNVSTIPLMGRAPHESLVDGNVLIWDAGHKKAIDGGINPAAIAESEVTRQANEAARVTNETHRSNNFETAVKAQPPVMSYVDYLHVKNDGWYISLMPDGSSVVSQVPPVDAVLSFQYRTNSAYSVIDDPEFAEKMATCSRAKELLDSMVWVTPEQYLELGREGLLDLENNTYMIDDEELFETLTVTIPAQEEQRQANEDVRQQWLAYAIHKHPWPITDAEAVKLAALGVFGVHFEDGEPVCTVYDNAPLAEAANETWVFPWQNDVMYPVEG